VVIPPPEDGMPTHGGSAVLFPFANRIRNGKYEFQGRKFNLPTNKEGHAIHGLVLGREWNVERVSGFSATLSLELSNPSYPTVLEAQVTYTLRKRELHVSLSSHNKGEYDGPLVVGFHPYFNVGARWKLFHDQPVKRLNTNSHFPDGTYVDFDFNSLQTPWNFSFDDCFLGGGLLTLTGEKFSISISRENMDFFQVYNGVHAKNSVAVEPMTGAPDAYNNGIGLRVLPPGGDFHCGFELSLKIL
jgi:Galactose mutarotase and related enzymes